MSRTSLVVASADRVTKTHAAVNPAALVDRLAAIQREPLAALWLPPLAVVRPTLEGDPIVTVWPRVEVLAPDGPLPWGELGELLARLHALPVPEGAPDHGGRTRLTRVVTDLRAYGDGWIWLAELAEDLLAHPPERRDAWVHGDFHLGQVGRRGGRWCFLDPDDVGVGDPAWDLGRIAGFWAVGLLDDEAWAAFIHGYREAGGRGVPAAGDPWPSLELAARAAVVIAAARYAGCAHSEPATPALLDACRRMAQSGA